MPGSPNITTEEIQFATAVGKSAAALCTSCPPWEYPEATSLVLGHCAYAASIWFALNLSVKLRISFKGDNSHLRTPNGISTLKVPINARRIIIDPLNCNSGSSNQGLQRFEERWPNEDTDIPRLGGSTSKDDGVFRTSLTKLIVCSLLTSQVGEDIFKSSQNTADSADCSIDRWEVVEEDGQEGIERCLSFHQLQFSVTESRSRDGRCDGEAEEGEQSPEVEFHVDVISL